MRKTILSLLFTLILCSPTFAGHPLITDDTGTLGKDRAQLETTYEFTSKKDTLEGISTKYTGNELKATVTYGPTDNIDISLGVPYRWQRIKEEGIEVYKGNGLSDMSLSLKWRFLESDGGWSFAIKPTIGIPSGDYKKGLGSGKVGYEINLITTKEIKPWAFHVNLDYKYNDNKLQERKNIWRVSAAMEVEAVKSLKLVGDIGIQKNADPQSDTNPAYILGGIIYSIVDNLDLDFGVKAGLNKAAEDYALLGGVTFKF